MRNDRLINGPHRQKGMATMFISLVLLVLITLVSLFTSRTVSLEQKVFSNDYRSRQAFGHAEAGLAAALAYFDEDPDVDEDGVIDAVYDTDNDGVGDTNTAVVGTGSVTVNTIDLSGGAMTSFQVTATGLSDDASATRTVTQVLASLNPLPNAPGVPLITRNSVVINGSATVTNPEGHSTIWSGDDVDMGSNNSTATNVADFTDANYPTCMDTPLTCKTSSSSNKTSIGLDVIEHDSSLSNLPIEGFFENLFGMSPEAYRASRVSLETTAANAATDLALATNEVIWVEGDITLQKGITVGCKTVVTGSNVCPVGDQKPSIVIINGNATFNSSPHFYGLLYVTGSIDFSANSTFYGAVIAGGDIINQGGGSLDIIYHSGLLGSLTGIGPLASSSGSWRDF